MSAAIDDEIDDEAPARPPTRRDGRTIAMPAEPIPAEVNEAFLEDLAFERALGSARDLVSSQTLPSALSAGGLQAVWRSHAPEKPRGRPDHLCPVPEPNPKENALNPTQTTDLAIPTFPSARRTRRHPKAEAGKRRRRRTEGNLGRSPTLRGRSRIVPPP